MNERLDPYQDGDAVASFTNYSSLLPQAQQGSPETTAPSHEGSKQPSEGKLDFLIHPDYRTARHGETSEHEEAARVHWFKEIEKIAENPQRILIILSSSTTEEQDQGDAVDAKLLLTAQEKLQERCIVVPYVEEDLSVYAQEIKEILVQNGLIEGKDLTEFSSSAFGEFAEACVVQIANELNQHLGLKRKTQIKTRKSLSIDGADSREVNTEVRRVINLLHLGGVVTKD